MHVGRSATAAQPLNDPYPELRRQLARAVARVCPRWLAERSDDIVQVAVLRLVELERRSEGPRELGPSYLWRVAYSAVIDEIRRLRRSPEVPIEELDAGGRGVAGAPCPERSAAGREIGQAIAECLRRTVGPRRQAAALHLQGHTVPEIGRLMGWSAKRAENLVYRGLADLRKCLTAKGMQP